VAAVFKTAGPADLTEVAALIADGPSEPAEIPRQAPTVDRDDAARLGPPEGQGLTTRLKRTLATRNGKLTAAGTALSLLAIILLLLIWIGPLWSERRGGA